MRWFQVDEMVKLRWQIGAVALVLLMIVVSGLNSLMSQHKTDAKEIRRYAGTWRLSHLDGSVEQIRLLPNGEVEANDDYRYRWKVKGNTVQIESWEQRTISPFAPQNALDWFTAKSEVTVLQVRARQDDSEALVLTGPGGSLTKMEDGEVDSE